jgi:hypothetical protein
VASTDNPGGVADRATAKIAEAPTVYRVPDWVRVRPEDFGLLFYDTRSTRLTFVRSGDKLVPPPFVGPCRLLTVRRSTEESAGTPSFTETAAKSVASAAPSDEALTRLLDGLAAKGLLVPAPGGDARARATAGVEATAVACGPGAATSATAE